MFFQGELMDKLDILHEVCDYVEEQLTHDGGYMTCSDCGVGS